VAGARAGWQITSAIDPASAVRSLEAGWWWWPSSRVLHDVDLRGAPIEIITEFPFFSYLLGDNHPHVLAMPFVTMVIGLAIQVSLSARAFGRPALSNRPLEPDPVHDVGAIVLVIAWGALLVMNTWDFPAAVALVILGFVVASRSAAPDSGRARRIVARAVAGSVPLVAFGIVAGLPYALT